MKSLSKHLLIALGMIILLLLAACGTFSSSPNADRGPINEEQLPTNTDTQTVENQSADDATEPESRNDETADNQEHDAEPNSVAQTLDAPLVEPSQIRLELRPIADNLTRPVMITHAGDNSGRLFILEQAGVIRIYQNDTVLDPPFLDIQQQVQDSGNEQGLLGLAFSPNYGNDGYAYVNYTGLDGSTVVSRFQRSADDPNRLTPESEFTILTIAQPAQNHNGGMLAFGPDGYLYIGTGDGGASNDRFGNGQNPSSLLGKMLRLDVTTDPSQPYLIPLDNPWVNSDWQDSSGNMLDVMDEIWSIGLRNPWRYSFDRSTGDLWIGDVGQNQYEEIHFVSANSLAPGAIEPLNFGWPIMEANHCFRGSDCDPAGLEVAVSEYDHSGHCSVTGGYVYRGDDYPILNGLYIFGDFCSGVIWTTAPDGSGGWSTTEMYRSDANISSFGESEEGELYMTDLGGAVYQVIATN